MADDKAQHPVGSILKHQNGATFVYLKAAQIMKANTLVKVNANGSVLAWEPTGAMLPEGLATEDLKINDYSFFLVQNGMAAPSKIKTK